MKECINDKLTIPDDHTHKIAPNSINEDSTTRMRLAISTISVALSYSRGGGEGEGEGAALCALFGEECQ